MAGPPAGVTPCPIEGVRSRRQVKLIEKVSCEAGIRRLCMVPNLRSTAPAVGP